MKHILAIILFSLLVKINAYSQCPVVALSDRSVCFSQSFIQLSAKGKGVWSTSGSGTFDTISIPTARYFFSSKDKSGGKVTLLYTSTACTPSNEDPVVITFQDPIINAGGGYSGIGTEPIFLNGYVSEAGSGVTWSVVDGTGSFSDPFSINPAYNPSLKDEAKGTITIELRMTACNTTFTDQAVITIQPKPVAVIGDFLDPTFNESGPVRGKKEFNVVQFASDQAVDLGVDLNGNVYTLGNSSEGPFWISKLNSRGERDNSFATSGFYIFNNPSPGIEYYRANSLARQPDGQILISGTKDSSGSTYGFILRLTSNGQVDGTFGLNGIRKLKLGASDVELLDIKTMADGRIVIAGKDLSTNKVFVARLRSNGQLDNTFNSGMGYYTETVLNPVYTGLDVKYNTGEVIYSVDYYNSSYFSKIIKLRSDGTLDLSFNKIGSRTLTLPYSSYSAGGIAFQPDGNILFGAHGDTNLVAYRLTQNGNLDTSFGENGIAYSPQLYYAGCNNIMIDGQGRVIITGVRDYTGFIAVRFKKDGTLDKSFASNGMYFDNSGSGTCITSSITPDNKVLLAGRQLTGNMDYATVMRLANTLSWNLIGNQFVLPGTSEIYEVKAPASWNYNYVWSYSSGSANSDVFFLPDNEGQKVLIYFNEGAKGGRLICEGYYDGVLKVSQFIDITINTVAAQAKLLVAIQCTPEVTDCSNNYISRFKLNQINNDSSLCQSTGYADYTKTGSMDSLIAGSVYTFQVNTESNDPLKYAAIWIDYNNDGNFDAGQEFVASTESTGSLLTFQNVIIRNSEGYTGPKRLRVRCKPYRFTGDDACPISGELGETEDYLVIINAQDELEAPEIITPNEDGKNDFFVIRGIDAMGNNALTIFDRYGKTVYSASQYQNNWDGKDEKGSRVTPGTYYYYFKNGDNQIRGFLEVRY